MTVSYVIAAGHAQVGDLVATARILSERVIGLVVGPETVARQVAQAGLDQVLWLGQPGQSALEAFAPAVAEIVRAQPGHVLAGRRSADRVLLGAAAAAIDALLVVGPTELAAEGDLTLVTAPVNGGLALSTVAFSGPLACLLDGGPVPDGPAGPIQSASGPLAEIGLVSLQPAASQTVDVAAAPRVVGIGGGLKSAQDLGLVEALAQSLNAALGCSRPVAEGLGWLPKERYIGLSGAHIAPQLYVAVGISGQLQHMAGCRQSETIVAINIDPEAPIMAQADYVLPGDLYQIVPALTRALA
ncbi:MAG: electron transfer flavoprotein subunit alpha/FixB family protein [Propionibacteriaceae bacterium]|jgi:electron transfer flavoprotein alpha subunit|nr:electron transfer flavoprotein subunit alpha/FixB family protein [Propionibacteriaceae bacterium]